MQLCFAVIAIPSVAMPPKPKATAAKKPVAGAKAPAKATPSKTGGKKPAAPGRRQPEDTLSAYKEL